jgi:sarcosine oxidase, subunit beta
MAHNVDVAVIGAGVKGLSTEFHLAEREAGDIAVFDRTGIAAGASGVQPGGVRQQWGTELNILMAQQSLDFYREIVERLEPLVDPNFRTCGYLFVASTAETAERFESEVALQNRLGVPSRLLSPDEATEIVPGLSPEAFRSAAFCQEDGYFDHAQGVVEAFAAAGIRKGVRVERAQVDELERRNRAWRLRFRDGATVEAENVVVAAYTDTPVLLAPLGVDVPIEPEDRYMFYSEPMTQRLFEPLVVASDRRFATKQHADGRVLASDLGAVGDPAEHREAWRQNVRAAVEEVFPLLEYVSLPLLVGGVYDVTPDRQAIVGPVPGHDGLWIAAGFSGHGFMMAPAVGVGIARGICGDDVGELIAQLGLERFSHGALVPESQVI